MGDADEANLSGQTNGSPGLRALYEYFASVREEIRAMGVSQEELFADIDAAIAEVRAQKREGNDSTATKGADWLDALYEGYAPIRQNISARGISSEEINADIDAAIAEVRADQGGKQG